MPNITLPINKRALYKAKLLPKVSVIMSVYNCANYLPQAIESILHQTFKDYEFIIINNVSPDNSANIVAAYAKSYPQIRVINNKQHKNFGEVQQQLIEEAKGEYLAFAHGDDLYKPQRLEKQVEYLDRNQDIGLLSTAFFNIGKKNLYRYKNYTDRDIKSLLLLSTTLNIPSVMFRSSLVCATNKLRMTVHLGGADDYQFFVNAAQITKLAVLPEPLTGWRIHEKQDSNLHKKEIAKGHREVARSHLAMFGIEPNDELLDILLQKFVNRDAYYNHKLTNKQMQELFNLVFSIFFIKNFYGYSGVAYRLKIKLIIILFRKSSLTMFLVFLYKILKTSIQSER